VNPSGLGLVPAWEVELSSGERWGSVTGGAGRLRLSAYAAKTGAQHLEPSGAEDAFLDSSAWEAGLGIGVEPLKGLRLGGALGWSQLDLEGRRRRRRRRGDHRGPPTTGT
jgi:hypothetical protein